MNEERVRSRLPAGLRRVLFGVAGNLYPKLDWAPKVLRAKTTFQALARDSADAYLHSVSVIPEEIRTRIYSEQFRRDLQGYHAREVFQRHAARVPSDHPLSLVQYLDMKTYLPGDILTKVDRASMAHALEVRVPLLDHPLVEWISGLDPGLKLRGQEGKYLFKKALEPYVDADVMYRPKMGFAVPIQEWFRGPLSQRLRDSLLGETLSDSGMFDMAAVSRLVRDHQSGVSNHTATLWSLLMFESFMRRESAPERKNEAA
jgi:asparagine synthase (glutamine-hydrolysing)